MKRTYSTIAFNAAIFNWLSKVIRIVLVLLYFAIWLVQKTYASPFKVKVSLMNRPIHKWGLYIRVNLDGTWFYVQFSAHAWRPSQFMTMRHVCKDFLSAHSIVRVPPCKDKKHCVFDSEKRRSLYACEELKRCQLPESWRKRFCRKDSTE